MAASRERNAQKRADEAAAPHIEVVSYSNARAYERDARWRLAHGWQIQGQDVGASRAKVGSKLMQAGALTLVGGPLGPASLLVPWRKKGKITVTWYYPGDEEEAPKVPLLRHLEGCAACQAEQPCDEWDRLYEEEDYAASGREQLERIRELEKKVAELQSEKGKP